VEKGCGKRLPPGEYELSPGGIVVIGFDIHTRSSPLSGREALVSN
jgi:hypothetical protein